MRILVTRPKALDRYIVLQSSIIISPADKAMFDGLPEEEKGLFAGRLAVELSKTGMGYVMDLATSSNITLLRRVPITANLNEGNFMEAVDALDNAKQGALRTLILMLVDLRKHLAAEEGAAQAQAAALLPPR
jgi:hypothetical protein